MMEYIAAAALIGLIICGLIESRGRQNTPRVIGGQSWWRDKQDQWAPPQHCDAPWNPWRDDTGPRGRVDVTPGGRKERADG